MKLQVVSALAVAVRTAVASMDNMFELMTSLEELSYNKSVEAGTATEEDRAFVGLIATRLTDLDHYGCWCYFDDLWDTAKGPVQDGLDAECKKLVNGYKCLVRDALDRGETCDPQSQSYETYNLFGANPDVRQDCTTNSNLDLPAEQQQCAIDLCIVEGTFTLTLFALLVSDYVNQNPQPYDPTLAHPTNVNAGVFDPAIECVTNTLNGAGRSDKECCGTHPERFEYKTFNGERACCGERTFNTVTLQCCDDVESCNGNTPVRNELLDTVIDGGNSCPTRTNDCSGE